MGLTVAASDACLVASKKKNAEAAILVLDVNSIKGHAGLRVPGLGKHRHDGQPSKPHANELHMKRIITHFLGDVSFETTNLQKIADTLDQAQGQELSDDDSIHANDATPTNDYSIDPLSTNTMQCSDDDCKVLGKGQGKASQTNYFYFHEATFREKLDFYYTTEHPLSINDAGWICTLLMTFAVGTQFAHMQTKSTPGSSASTTETSPDDQIGLELYRFSCRLIPDLVTVASVETVQAFLLLGVYTLPIDTAGLAYVYYGLAIKMAIQNGMHRKLLEDNLAPEIIEVRNRLWWSAYSLESRISILHGRPGSVSPAEIDTPMPVDLPSLRSGDQLTNLPSFTATIVLTNHLAKAADAMRSLRRCQRARKKKYIRRLAATRDQLSAWWESLPTETHCRDLNPTGTYFRCNVHLEIYYTTTLIYMGRPFIISQATPGSFNLDSVSTVHEVSDIVNTLRRDSLHAALRVIELCQLLQDTVGLARVSYTEFNGCRVALLALIAHSINEPTTRISSVLTQGMGLIRQICPGLESARSEVAVIEALERARQRLHNYTMAEQSGETDHTTGYDQFTEWARLWRSDPVDGSDVLVSTNLDMPYEQRSPNSVPSFDGFFSSFPNELGEFAAIPGLDYDLSLAQEWLDGPQPDGSEWIMNQPL
ncbi:Transcription factor [Penicillium griseofulvum]|uniref:Transcription factor n=1 Tax=Penicillium patulum TaxID=5078 RepID=A0A135LML1_PENPA|nr:Transcription factor [Penicillium griseofulvum]KXG50186.1 Transcription factor [Penicillium griseofulvum]